MSPGLTVVVAVSTAATVVLITFLLSKLVHTVVESTSGIARDTSRFRRLVGRRSSRESIPARPVRDPVARRPRVEPIEKPAVPTAEKPAPVLPARKASPIPVIEAPAPAVAPDFPPGRSVDVKAFSRAKSDEGDRRAEPDAASYRQVGEEVTAVLTAAERAAAQIRETALREAEQTRRAAEEQAAAIAAEAQTQRAETDRYSEETRTAAEAYAEERRRRTDEEAARTVSQAEKQASVIRAEAEQKASEIKAEAARRRDALKTRVEGMEERIESMLGVFRRGATELEELLPAERRSSPGENERLDDALTPKASRGEVSSHAEH